jgi:hypothetical protein
VHWKASWPLIKDVGLTGTGIFVIVLEAFSAHPSGLLLGTGLALTVPSTWDHIRALMPSSGGGSSSEPSQVPGSSPSQLPSREPPGE